MQDHSSVLTKLRSILHNTLDEWNDYCRWANVPQSWPLEYTINMRRKMRWELGKGSVTQSICREIWFGRFRAGWSHVIIESCSRRGSNLFVFLLTRRANARRSERWFEPRCHVEKEILCCKPSSHEVKWNNSRREINKKMKIRGSSNMFQHSNEQPN